MIHKILRLKGSWCDMAMSARKMEQFTTNLCPFELTYRVLSHLLQISQISNSLVRSPFGDFFFLSLCDLGTDLYLSRPHLLDRGPPTDLILVKHVTPYA